MQEGKGKTKKKKKIKAELLNGDEDKTDVSEVFFF